MSNHSTIPTIGPYPSFIGIIRTENFFIRTIYILQCVIRDKDRRWTGGEDGNGKRSPSFCPLSLILYPVQTWDKSVVTATESCVLSDNQTEVKTTIILSRNPNFIYEEKEKNLMIRESISRYCVCADPMPLSCKVQILRFV